MPFVRFSELKRQVSIATVLEDRGLLPSLKKQGNDLVGPCPVHQGDNPGAFVVNLEKNLWHCFTRCMGGGDVIHLVMRLDGMGYYEAAQYLQCLSRNTPTPQVYQENHLKIPKNPIPHVFTPYTARLRLHPNIPFLASKGIKPSTAMLFEAGAYSHQGMLSGCVAVRLHNIKGRPLGYAGRRLDPIIAHRLGKWIFPKTLPKKELLYNYHRIRNKFSGKLVVTECPWGVMRLAQLSIPAVSLLGTNLSDLQLTLLKRVSEVRLMLDGDQAGRIATEKVKHRLKPYLPVSSVYLPTGKDPDDLDDLSLIHLIQDRFE